MANFDKQDIYFQRGTGAIPGTFATVYSVTVPAIAIASSPAAITYSTEIWLRAKFPTAFAAGTPVNMKIWKCSGQLHTDYKLNCGYTATYAEPAATPAVQSSVATTEIIKQLSLAYDDAFTGLTWDNTNKFVGYIVLQIESASGADAFNSTNSKRPLVLTFAYDRGDVKIADYEYLKGQIKDFAILSNWDMYFIDENDEEQYLGYMDNSFPITEQMDIAELLNGLPESTIANAIIKVGAEITGNLQTFDPYIQKMIGHYSSSDEGQRVRLTQSNVVKEIDSYHFILRGQNTSGHLMEFHIPEGQIFKDGDVTLGGNEFIRLPIRIKATAQENTGTTHYWEMSEVPVEKINLVINYSGA